MSVSSQFGAVDLSYQPSSALPKRLRSWLLPPAQFSLVADRAERAELERYIAGRFGLEYGAKVDEFMPHLVRMTCCGKTSAALGIRCAAEGNLFVEQYLDRPIEETLTTLADETCRSHITELGNLVASHRGASRLLFLTVANSLNQANVAWIVFAATRQVAKLVAKFPCDTFDLGPADPTRLGGNADKWGSYYDTNPRVIAMHLPSARQQVQTSTTAALVLQLYQQPCQELGQQLSHAFQMAAFRC